MTPVEELLGTVTFIASNLIHPSITPAETPASTICADFTVRMFVADGGVFTQLGQLSMGVQLFFCEICGGGMCCLSSTLDILMPMVSSRFVF